MNEKRFHHIVNILAVGQITGMFSLEERSNFTKQARIDTTNKIKVIKDVRDLSHDRGYAAGLKETKDTIDSWLEKGFDDPIHMEALRLYGQVGDMANTLDDKIAEIAKLNATLVALRSENNDLRAQNKDRLTELNLMRTMYNQLLNRVFRKIK